LPEQSFPDTECALKPTIRPGILGAVEHLDVAALVALRPILVETGTADVIFPVAAARQTVADLREIYRALGAPDDALVHDAQEGGHRWYGAKAYEPFAQSL
jgi:hypothetical protein